MIKLLMTTMLCFGSLSACEGCRIEMTHLFHYYDLEEDDTFDQGFIRGVEMCLEIHDYFHLTENSEIVGKFNE